MEQNFKNIKILIILRSNKFRQKLNYKISENFWNKKMSYKLM